MPQFSVDERNFLCLEYHKRKGHRDFLPGLLEEFSVKFPEARIPAHSTVRKIYSKQMRNGTVVNCNSKSSPGDSIVVGQEP